MAKPNIRKRVLALSFASLMLVSGCSVGIGSNNIVAGGQKAHSDSQQGSYKSCLQGATEGGKTAGDLGDQNHLSGRSEELSDEQNKVAQTIVSVGQNRGLSEKGQAIAVSVGLVESELTNVDYGDDIHGVRNPDGTLTSSLGVFQQQNFWGSKEERMNVSRSSEIFYEHLEAVSGWESMDPGTAAQTVQGSAFPGKYSVRYEQAMRIVKAVTSEGGNNRKSTDDKNADAKEASNTLDKRKAKCSSANVKPGEYIDTQGHDTYPLKRELTPTERNDRFSNQTDPWGSYYGQCVSYVLWKLNEAHGANEDDYVAGTKADYGMAGDANASNWDNIDRNFATVDHTPTKGAIAQFEPGTLNGTVGGYGHVAWVEEVDEANGRVRVSQYNWEPLAYNEVWLDKDSVSNYIHVK